MKPIIDILEQRIAPILAQIAPDIPNPPAIVKPSQDTKFGDYQANGIMSLAKRLKQNPRDLAQQVIDQLDVADMCEPPEIAGPGFINFRLLPAWLVQQLTQAIADQDRLGVNALANPPRVVVDFSGPNLAKQMHVGHLRSTIIGDVIARILEFYYDDNKELPITDLKKRVIRQNHLGDWGLQMGMIIYAVYETYCEAQVQWIGPNTKLRGLIPLNELNLSLDELECLYKDISEKIAAGDKKIEDECRACLLKLQQGDPEITEFWSKAREVTLNACNVIYKQLDVKLGLDDVRGESDYNKDLPNVIADLDKNTMLRESEGAQCVSLDGFKNKDGDPLPMIVQKSDGAYLYATTDLAAIRYRVNQLHADRVIYVTDSRQKLHFQMIFACARQAQWAPESVSLEHVPFGTVLGPDNKPFKTRSGENVKLAQLLDEATQRALKVVETKNPDLPPDQKRSIAQAVGIGAVKYADLSNNLVGDYVFDWDKMLAMEGNTAPYLQYAYARIQSIFRKAKKANIANTDEILTKTDALQLDAPEELTLAKHLLRYGEVIETVARDLRPHLLTTYLFELAQNFSGFYTNCPVLKPESAATRDSRLLLCHHTARTLAHGLDLLGIKTIQQM